MSDDEAVRLATEVMDQPFSHPYSTVYALAETVLSLHAEREQLRMHHHPVPPFGIISATAASATSGPVHIEPDDSLAPMKPIFRIVQDETARRYREDYKTTARPDYIATVYSAEDAQFYSLLHNHGMALVQAHAAVLDEREQLRKALGEALDGWLRATSSGIGTTRIAELRKLLEGK